MISIFSVFIYSENLASCGYSKNLVLAQKNLASCGYSKNLASCGYSKNLASCGYSKNLALAQKNHLKSHCLQTYCWIPTKLPQRPPKSILP